MDDEYILYLRGITLDDVHDEKDFSEIFDQAALEEFDTSEDSDDPDMEALQREMEIGFQISNTGSSIRPEDLAALCQPSIIVHEKPPKYFFDRKRWPNSTFLKCWYCDCQVSGPPRFIALEFTIVLVPGPDDKAIEEQAIKTHGNFCTFNCAVAHIQGVRDPKIGFKQEQLWEKRSLTRIAYQKFHGRPISTILPSPPKYKMVQFGDGDMSQEDYRNIVRNLDKENHEAEKADIINSF